MSERLLITKLVRKENTADLYARGHRWPDLKLFDISDLADVGIEFATLETDTEIPCRFWAYYELSEKLNKAGNPYKNVVALEALDLPATTTSTDNSAILAELRAIRQLLETLTPDRAPRPIPVSVVGATPRGCPTPRGRPSPDNLNNLDDFFPRDNGPPAAANTKVPSGDYQNRTLAWLLEHNRAYLERISKKANDTHLRAAALTVLDWSRESQILKGPQIPSNAKGAPPLPDHHTTKPPPCDHFAQ